MSADTTARFIEKALLERFGEHIPVNPETAGLPELERIATWRSQRRYASHEIDAGLLRFLCACALSAPSKSDLQQADIVIVHDKAVRKGIAATIPDMPWIEGAAVFLVFVANGERLPLVAKIRDKPFPNDHLDAFFNATVDC